jgi:hypothetical protein
MAKQPCRICRQALPAVAFKEKRDGTRTLTCMQYLAEQRFYIRIKTQSPRASKNTEPSTTPRTRRVSTSITSTIKSG